MASRSAFYVTTIDRAGLALGAGGILTGVATLLLVLMGGQRDPLMLVGALAIGGIFGMIGIVGIAGPIWLALHVAGRRGPIAAALTGAGVALFLFTAGQTWSAPELEAGAASYRLLSAVGTSGLVALAAAGIGWTMQRIAYRRLM